MIELSASSGCRKLHIRNFPPCCWQWIDSEVFGGWSKVSEGAFQGCWWPLTIHCFYWWNWCCWYKEVSTKNLWLHGNTLGLGLSKFFCRYDANSGGEREIQRTMLELLNQLDGFDSRGDVKVILATNRIESLDPALLRPGRIDRKIEFPLPDIKTRRRIFQVCGLLSL